jgi:hypothetical protein
MRHLEQSLTAGSALTHGDRNGGPRSKWSDGPEGRVCPGLAEIDALPPVGHNYDNALAETVNSYYTADPIRGPARRASWKTVVEVELATLAWAHWHNTQHLHGHLGAVL